MGTSGFRTDKVHHRGTEESRIVPGFSMSSVPPWWI